MKKIIWIIILVISCFEFCIIINSKNTNDSDLRNISREDSEILFNYYNNIDKQMNSLKLISGRIHKNDNKKIEFYIYFEISKGEQYKLRQLKNLSIITENVKNNKVYIILRKISDLESNEINEIKEIFEKNKRTTILPFIYIKF